MFKRNHALSNGTFYIDENVNFLQINGLAFWWAVNILPHTLKFKFELSEKVKLFVSANSYSIISHTSKTQTVVALKNINVDFWPSSIDHYQ